jgi:hypothetical protein
MVRLPTGGLTTSMTPRHFAAETAWELRAEIYGMRPTDRAIGLSCGGTERSKALICAGQSPIELMLAGEAPVVFRGSYR